MSYTCNTCGLAFATPEDQRVHMKSDWHRYNLKRRVAQLPPIDEDLFNSKVASLTIAEETPAEPKKSNKQLTKKEIRRREKEAIHEKKKQILEMARQNMLAGNKRESSADGEATEETAEAAAAAAAAAETVASDAAQPEAEVVAEELTEEQQAEQLMAKKIANRVHIPSTTCLFCPPKAKMEFETVDLNIEHMFKQHGFYIPEQKYLEDKDGLIAYLGEKIGLGNVCLSCTYQGRNTEAVREHMKVKRHMRLPYELEDEKLEVSQFYDFSSTYEPRTKIVVPESESAADGEDWEDVSDEGEDADSDSEDDLPPAEDNALLQNGHELVLPSGAVIGHRSMARYYRQNLAPERILTEGQGTVIAAETRHMFTVKDRQELALQKRTWAREKKREDVNDRRAAKFINNQPHFRDPLLQ
ncbi:cytoplasmic 60S subunit biogenesis factor Rei1p [[Candida] anglica]|uniref:Cytoplasmic 60S subunit biogenesis factor Rei1p n=1 Tax=[Candida] anglica TaxID=148631 RepID=A0ABP0EBA9_9ASCO